MDGSFRCLWKLSQHLISQRSHQALEYQVLMDRYRGSPWSYPQQLTELEYGPGDVLARMYPGRFRFKKRYFSAAKGLVEQFIANVPGPTARAYLNAISTISAFELSM